MKIISTIKDNPLYYFFLKAISFYVFWQVLYDLIILPNGIVDEFLSISVAHISNFFLSLLGWDIGVSGRIITISGYLGVEVLNDCNALKLMALYSGFIFAYEGPLLKRVQFLCAGILLIYILNVLRIMAFSLATVYFQPHWDTFHEFSSFIFFYPIILWIWYKWTLLKD
tara:strand:+ start:37 stop:543 length:507 start_codon:yes stop_codon:yes gene_type:complete